MFDNLIELIQTFWSEYLAEYYEAAASFEYIEETLGAAAALFLFIILVRRIRKRRRRSKAAVISRETGSLDQTAEEAVIEPEENKYTDTFYEQTAETEVPISEKPSDQMAEASGEEIVTPIEPEPEPAKPEPVNLMSRLKNGLTKTRNSLTGRIESVFSDKQAVDSETLEEIEEALITSDVGVNTTMALIGKIEQNASNISDMKALKTFLQTEMLSLIGKQKPIEISNRPYVIMVVGVNGVGKTTTIGKLAHKYASEGKKVLLGAADTFRAAAVEQLEIWSQRADVEIVKHRENADPAAVAFDAVEAGIARDSDIVIIDTAGRLHTKVNLMEQLKKIKRSITKKLPSAPHEVLLVLDATTGQNALSQAKLFHEGIGVTSLILTKLDGTAKGGIVVSICNTMQLPLRFIGVGEAMEDLQPFEPERFVKALF